MLAADNLVTRPIVIGFPIWLLWGVRISFRKKLALGAIFSLVGFTIAATILRGALLSEVFQTTVNNSSTFNIPWVWFWFNIELCTGKSIGIPAVKSPALGDLTVATPAHHKADSPGQKHS